MCKLFLLHIVQFVGKCKNIRKVTKHNKTKNKSKNDKN